MMRDNRKRLPQKLISPKRKIQVQIIHASINSFKLLLVSYDVDPPIRIAPKKKKKC